MSRMSRVGDRIKELRVAVNAAAVFRRTRHAPIQARWRGNIVFGVEDLLDPNLVHPAVPEVVLVADAPSNARRNLKQRDPPIAHHASIDFRINDTKPPALRVELMEVRVGPSHRDLQDAVKSEQRRVSPHNQAAPDRRARATKRDLDLIDGFRPDHRRSSPTSRHAAHRFAIDVSYTVRW